MEDMDVSLPSESYQDLSFLASGDSGLITTLLLLMVDNETPEIDWMRSANKSGDKCYLNKLFNHSKTKITLKVSNFERLDCNHRRLISHV